MLACAINPNVGRLDFIFWLRQPQVLFQDRFIELGVRRMAQRVHGAGLRTKHRVLKASNEKTSQFMQFGGFFYLQFRLE